MLSGFAISCLFWTCGWPLDDSARAQGLFDLFGGSAGIFGAPQPPAPQEQEPSQRPIPSERRHHKSKHAERDAAPPAGSGTTSMCVRTCDGYAFPVGTYRGEVDRPAHEATCRAQCPGAATALYLKPTGSDSIDDAVRADSRQAYSKLPSAFKFKTNVSQACTCHLDGAYSRVSLARDYTLRRGDVVMTKDGLKVFEGGRFPFKVADFSPLLRSRDVPRKNLAIFEAMNRARLKADTGRDLIVTGRSVSAPRPDSGPARPGR